MECINEWRGEQLSNKEKVNCCVLRRIKSQVQDLRKSENGEVIRRETKKWKFDGEFL